MSVTVGWVYHDDFLRHDTGPSHPEQPARLLAVCLALDRAGLLSRMSPIKFTSDDRAYRQAMSQKVLPAFEHFSPELILVSAGFDAAADEPIANMNLQPASFGWITDQLVQVADACCAGRLISVLEGGYDTTVLARSAVAHVSALLG